MPFQFDARHGVAKNVRRVVAERLEDAQRQLRGELERDRDAAIHEARKDIKRVRAVLRLLRPVLPPARYRRANDALRKAAHALAGARDRRVLLDTLDGLVPEGSEGASAAESARTRLRARHREPGGEATGERAALAALDAVRRDARRWKLAAAGWAALEPGLRRMYRRGARRAGRAFASGDDEELHELRRHVKDLGYVLRLLEPSWPGPISATRQELERLAQLLGDDHDLALLRKTLAPTDPRPDDPAGIEEVRDSALRASAALRQEARDVAQLVYAEPPDAFVARHRSYWRAWRLRERSARRDRNAV